MILLLDPWAWLRILVVIFDNLAKGAWTQVRPSRTHMGSQPTQMRKELAYVEIKLTQVGKEAHARKKRWRAQGSNPGQSGENCHSLPLS